LFIAYTVIAVLLAPALLASAYTKLTKNKRLVDGFTAIGVPVPCQNSSGDAQACDWSFMRPGDIR
jgi:hypothetical protein